MAKPSKDQTKVRVVVQIQQTPGECCTEETSDVNCHMGDVDCQSSDVNCHSTEGQLSRTKGKLLILKGIGKLARQLLI